MMISRPSTPHLQRALGVLRWLFPEQCTLCGGIADAMPNLCFPCAAELPRPSLSCKRCGSPNVVSALCLRCIKKPPPYTTFRAALHYKGVVVDLIHRYKFGKDLAAGATLAGVLCHSVQQAKLLPADCIVPIPLHPERLRQRGFNQSGLLAKALAKPLKLAVVHGLERKRDTVPQSTLHSYSVRKRNVSGVFVATGDLQGKHPILLDDVSTSGATLRAATRTLIAGGALSVQVLVVAQA